MLAIAYGIIKKKCTYKRSPEGPPSLQCEARENSKGDLRGPGVTPVGLGVALFLQREKLLGLKLVVCGPGRVGGMGRQAQKTE